MDPAYSEIGPNTCVGMSAGWNSYSWVPAIILTTIMLMFLLDFTVERYVETKYGIEHAHGNVEALVTTASPAEDPDQIKKVDDDEDFTPQPTHTSKIRPKQQDPDVETLVDSVSRRSFEMQIGAFLILEFGVIFHSVIIGLNLGTAGSEFTTLYPVIVFHQAFEGLGIGARMSAIPFPSRWAWLQWALCAGYGLTTPISIAIGLGLRTTYNPGSFTANVVSGILDSLSAGVLIYTGLVELLARDFLFERDRTASTKRLAFMVACTFLGAGVMALLGKWA
jgi:zinc transporter 1/2/3